MASSPKLSTPADPYSVVICSYVPEIAVTAVASIVAVVFPSIAEFEIPDEALTNNYIG